jgi:hypothetical protein
MTRPLPSISKQRPLRASCLSRFHRLPGFRTFARSRVSGNLLRRFEIDFHELRSSVGHVPPWRQPAHSGNDGSRVGRQEERHPEGHSRNHQTKISLPCFACQLREKLERRIRQPSFGAKLIAFFFRLMPKIGPFRTLAFKVPTPEVEKLFMASFNGSVDDYEKLLREVQGAGGIDLVNDNFDTGTVTKPGEYPLADKTFADLLGRLAQNQFAGTSQSFATPSWTFTVIRSVVTRKKPLRSKSEMHH